MEQENRLGIITYNIPHQKTDLVLASLIKKYDPRMLTIFCLPYSPRPERMVFFEHRPVQTIAASPADYSKAYGMRMIECQDDSQITPDCTHYLILVGKLLSAQAVCDKKIVNVHPGLIPAARGLDSFKWAIYRQLPLGHTMHYIDAQIDEGQIVSQIVTPVFPSDTLESLAQRHYYRELEMSASFLSYIQKPVFEISSDSLEENLSTKRMPYETERQLLSAFELYKKKFAKGKVR